MSLSRGSELATKELGMEPIPFGDKERPKKKRRVVQHSIHSISWRWPVFMLLGGCLAFYIVHVIDHILPTGVTEEEALANKGLFSGVRSRNTLRRLTSLGPRVVGTYQNNVLAPAILQDELRLAKLMAHSSQSLQYEFWKHYLTTPYLVSCYAEPVHPFYYVGYIEDRGTGVVRHIQLITFQEVQTGSGAYTLEYKPRFTNIYENIQNVIARLEGSDPSHSILLNCHYDTVPTSDGASDAAIACSVMMELIRVLAQSEVRLKHNVIFLFNGAEEVSLQASHLFLTHRWAETIRAFVNLEGAGLGGRAILFQSGPDNAWLFRYYARSAPHPHGLIFGEELFQSGFIPSDSDFRIFRDFKKIPGLDFAFGRNGQVYHTVYDKEAYIPLGSHQHLGENILALVRVLGHAPEVENLEDHKEGQMVYFDYLGWFMVSYSEEAGIAINVIVFLLTIISVVVFIGRLSQWQWLPQSMGKMGEIWDKKFKSKDSNNDSDYSDVNQTKGSSYPAGQGGDSKEIRDGTTPVENGSRDNELEPTLQSEFVKNPWAAWKEMSFAFGARLMGMLSGVLGAVIMAAFIDGVATLAMPWYSNVWTIFPLFWCPCLFGYGLVPMAVDWWRSKKHGLSLSMTAQLHLVAAQIPWALIMIIMTGLGIRSATIVMFPVLFSSVALLLIHLTPLYRTVHTWTWVYLVIHIPSVIFQMYVALLVYTVFLPVMGRSGTINGDLYIAVVTSIITLYVMNSMVPFLSLMRRPALVLGILLGCGLLMLPISLATDVGHPYTAGPENPAPQRYWIMHSDRKFYDEKASLKRHDTGYFVLNQDRNSPRTIPLGNRSISTLGKDCDDELYCGLPLYRGRMVPLSRASSWIPSGPPVLPTPTDFILNDRSCPTPTQCTMDFRITGPIRLTITFAPRDGVTVDGWSLPTPPVAASQWKGRPTYFLHIVRTDITKDFFLSIHFKVTNSSSPLMDLGLAGNYIDHDRFRTEEYQTFLQAFPDWIQMVGWISAYSAHVF